MLRHRADLQSLLYMLLYPALIAWQWRWGIHWLLYPLMLYIGVGLAVAQHNHTHLFFWRSRALNRLTDLWLSVLQGSPTFVFYPTHIAEHHRYNGGPLDLTSPSHFGGHHTHLKGYLLHPFQALNAIKLLIASYVKRRWAQGDRWPVIELAVIALSWLILLNLDPRRCLLLILLPQLHSAHWLLGANYLQHAHPSAPDEALGERAYTRNFTGWMNYFWFNIGYHSAHHENGKLHWSELPKRHAELRDDIPPQLIEPSMAGYMIRTYLLRRPSAEPPHKHKAERSSAEG